MNYQGYNNALDSTDLQESESPDCMNVRPYKGRQGLLAPRPGFYPTGSSTNGIMGMYKFTSPWSNKWMVVDNNGQVLETAAQETPVTQQFVTANTNYTLDSILGVTYEAADGPEKECGAVALNKVLNVCGTSDQGPHGMIYLPISVCQATWDIDGVYPDVNWFIRGTDVSGNDLHCADGTTMVEWILGYTFPNTLQMNCNVTGYQNEAISATALWLPFKRWGLSSVNAAVYKLKLVGTCSDWTEAATGQVTLNVGTSVLFGEVP